MSPALLFIIIGLIVALLVHLYLGLALILIGLVLLVVPVVPRQ